MKKISLFLDKEDFEDLTLGFLPISPSQKEHELFFHLNLINRFYFERAKDFIVEGEYFTYLHSVFKGYQEETKTTFVFISNQSYHTTQKKEITELFIDEQNVNFLLKHRPSSGYIIKTFPITDDFSLILLPEKVNSIDSFHLNALQTFYHLIENYE